ncbi:MAG TPA: hypothetical protein VNT75_32660 [Symbiobacteriaceae bacterium]|nr:hypothetical protein [Symbiobacteriaceae bacterium]
MKDVGSLLSRGLKEWVDEGVCPPEVLARIEASLRPARKRPWWQSWPAYAGAVAAVFLIMVVAASQTMDLSHQIASIPFVGGLATNLLYPGTDVEVDDLKEPGEPVTSTEHDGIRLDLFQPTLSTDALRLQYALRGTGLDTQAGMSQFEAVVEGPKGALKLRRTQIVRSAGEVLMTVEYEPTLPGQTLTLTVKDLPGTTQEIPGVWQVTFKR